MNHDASIENAHNLLAALEAAGAIDQDQKESLAKAFSENTAKSPEQLFGDARLFNEKEVSSLCKALQLLAAGRISKEHIALYVLTNLQAGKPLGEALNGLEDMAKQDESTVLPYAIRAYKRAISEEHMKELEKRLTESPQVPWEDHVAALNVLQPKDLEIAKLGQSMIDKGEIKESQFSVALYDYLTGMCSLEESLTVRGWWPESRTKSASG